MGVGELPPRRDATDDAMHTLLEYLALAHVVEGELSAIAPAVRHVILSLLLAEESAGNLTPYREHLLGLLRKSKGGHGPGEEGS